MNKQEFIDQLSRLDNIINSIEHHNYHSAWNALIELKKFIKNNQMYLSMFQSEHIGDIEVDLDKFRNSKRYSDKKDYWENAISNLNSEIDSLKWENDFSK